MEDRSHKKLSSFYLIVVLALMLLFPVLSAWIERLIKNDPLFSITRWGKWFLFWSVGVRLFTAGCKQAIHPSFTAKNIFHLEGTKNLVVVKELGFANICLGTMGILSLFFPQSRIVASITGGLFFGIAGATHLIKKPAGPNEWIALISDLFIFLIMFAYVVFSFQNE